MEFSNHKRLSNAELTKVTMKGTLWFKYIVSKSTETPWRIVLLRGALIGVLQIILNIQGEHSDTKQNPCSLPAPSLMNVPDQHTGNSRTWRSVASASTKPQACMTSVLCNMYICAMHDVWVLPQYWLPARVPENEHFLSVQISLLTSGYLLWLSREK